MLCVETSTRSTCCSIVSGGYLNTLTFVGLMFHTPKLLSIRPFSHRFEFGLFLCVAAFCTFVIAFVKRLPSTQPSHAVAKRTAVDAYKYIYKLDARLDSLAFPVIRD